LFVPVLRIGVFLVNGAYLEEYFHFHGSAGLVHSFHDFSLLYDFRGVVELFLQDFFQQI
jgi:hypothetical protein